MKLAYDPAKNAWNVHERGLSFAEVASLDWLGAIVRPDTRRDYGEDRYQALADGFDGKPYVVVFTMRSDTMWDQLPPGARDGKKELWRNVLTHS